MLWWLFRKESRVVVKESLERYEPSGQRRVKTHMQRIYGGAIRNGSPGGGGALITLHAISYDH